LFALFITLTVLLVFVGIWRLVARRGNAVSDRLRDYAAGEAEVDEGPQRRRPQRSIHGRIPGRSRDRGPDRRAPTGSSGISRRRAWQVSSRVALRGAP